MLAAIVVMGGALGSGINATASSNPAQRALEFLHF